MNSRNSQVLVERPSLPPPRLFFPTFPYILPSASGGALCAAASVLGRKCGRRDFSCGSRSGSPSLTSTAQDELLHPSRAFCVCECGLCCQLSRGGGNPLCPLLRNKLLTSSPTDRPTDHLWPMQGSRTV